MYLTVWFIVLFSIIIYSGHYFLNKILCPNCDTPLTYEGDDKGLLTKYRPPTAFLRKKCAKCGWDLNKNL